MIRQRLLGIGLIDCLVVVKSVLCWFGFLSLTVFSFGYFGFLGGIWMVTLTLLGLLHFPLAVLSYFVAAPVDSVQPTAFGLLVSYSEVGLALLLALFFYKISSLEQIDWQPLLWSVPFAVAVCLSGLIHIPLFKVLPHLFRSCEFILAFWLAIHAVKISSAWSPSAVKPTSLLLWSHSEPETVRSFFWGSAVIAAGAAASLFYSLHGVTTYAIGSSEVRAASVFQNANLFGGYLAVMIAVTWTAALVQRRVLFRQIWFYLVGLTIFALFLTGSRTSLLATFTVLPPIWIYLRRKGIREALWGPRDFLRNQIRSRILLWVVNLTVCALLLAGLLATTELGVKLERLGKNVVARSSLDFGSEVFESRAPYWRVGLLLWSDHPLFGVGPGMFEDRLSDYKEVIEAESAELSSARTFRRLIRLQVHSAFLQLAVDFGVLGLLGMLCFFGYLIKVAWSQRKKPLGLAGLGVIGVLLITSILDIGLLSIPIETGLLCGLLLESARRREPLERSSKIPPKICRFAG